MKKRLAILFIVLVIFGIYFSIAEETADVSVDTISQNSEISQVNNAYDCLNDIVDSKNCDDLTTEEKIFALLSVGKCKNELMDDSSNSGECWPKGSCSVKTTSQAILALSNSGSTTDAAEEWLLSKTEFPPELSWFLQIDSNEETLCDIYYNGKDYSTTLKEDKIFTSGAGSCLTLVSGGYWLKISPSCYGDEIKVSCDKSFQTNLLYRKTASSTIYVSEKTNSAAAQGQTIEIVNSSCFSKHSGSCDYEGSLWATLVLRAERGESAVSSFLPYLVALAESNENLLPQAFLYHITAYPAFRDEILSSQKSGKYWEKSSKGKYYDTALALLPFGSETPTQEERTKEWLLDEDVQGENGCWDNGNIVSNGFLLFSLWPKTINLASESSPSCEDSGYYCLSSQSCSGTILSGYDCPGTFACCSTQNTVKTCVERSGTICNSNQICTGTSVEASDISYGQSCCTGGICKIPDTTISECEQNFGECRTSCLSGEEISKDECSSGSVCCVEIEEEAGSYWWLWLLIVLIVLVVLGIIFKSKLKNILGAGKSLSNPSSPSYPSRPISPMARPNPMMRPSQLLAQRRGQENLPASMSEVLDKLKKFKI